MKIQEPQWVGEYCEYGFEKFKPKLMFAIDTETTGLDPWGTYKLDRKRYPARLFAISVCDMDGNKAYIRVPVNGLTRRPDYSHKGKGWLLLAELLASAKVQKIFHNYMFDLLMLEFAGFKVAGRCHDTAIRMHVINSSEHTYGLKPLTKKYLGIDDGDQQDLIRTVLSGRAAARKCGWATGTDVDTKADYWLGDAKACRKYAEIDAYRTACLYLAQEEEIGKDKKLQNLNDREVRTMHTIKAMTKRGVAIDMPRSKEVMSFYKKIIKKSEKTIARLAGVDFNPRSPKQMSQMFYGQLGHTPLEYSKKKRGAFTDCQHCKGQGCKICQHTGKNPKCDGAFLHSIAVRPDGNGGVTVVDPLAYAILERSAAGTMAGYVQSYIDYAELDENGEWILHPNYKQHGTKTGRLSAQNPNLQNVASDDSGKKKVDMPYRPRECFIPRKGYKLYIPDFSQIEVWILAIVSGDTVLLDQLAKGGDAHQIVADMAMPGAYDKKIAATAETLPPEELTEKQKHHLHKKKTVRKIIKTINFGIIYGQGDQLTADSLAVPLHEAVRFKKEYNVAFPRVRDFMEQTVQMARREGKVESIYGRTYIVDKKLAYIGTNYRIQGAAAELMKAGMVAVHGLRIDGLHLLLQIHDELLIEVREDIDTPELQRAIALAMAIDWKLLKAPIPFPVGMKVSETRWSESREVAL